MSLTLIITRISISSCIYVPRASRDSYMYQVLELIRARNRNVSSFMLKRMNVSNDIAAGIYRSINETGIHPLKCFHINIGGVIQRSAVCPHF